MSLHGYPTRVDEYESDDDIYHPSPYPSPRFQRRLSLQKPPMRFNPGYYDPDDQIQDDLSLPMHRMALEDYPPRWTPPFYDEPHPGYLQRPFLVPEEDYPYYPEPARQPPHHWAPPLPPPPPADFRFQGDRLSDNEMMREPPFLHRSFSSRSHRPDRPNQRMPPRRFRELDDESDDEPPLSRRSSTGFRPPPPNRRRRRANSLSAMPTPSRSKDRMRPPSTPFHYSEDEQSISDQDEIPTVPGPRLNASHSYANFGPPPMQPNGPPVILPQHMPGENGPPPPMGPPNPMFVPQPGDYFEPRMNNAQEGTGPSTPSANEPNNHPPPNNNNNNNMPPPHMGQWMGPPPPHPGPPVFPGSPGGNNPMFNQQNMMGMGMPNPMVNMFNNPMMAQLWGGFQNYPMPFMGASEPTLVNPESTSPHRPNDKEKPRSEPSHEKPHQTHPDMQAPHQSMMKPESSNSHSRRRFSIFNIFGKKNEYHYEPHMQPFPEDQFRPPLPNFPGPFSIPIQDKSSKERKKIDQYEKLGTVWAWRVTQEPENLENIRLFCPQIDVTRHYSFNINNQKLIKRKEDRPEIMLGSEKHLNGNLMIRPGVRAGFFIPKNANRNDPVVIRLDLIVQQFNRAEVGNGFVLNHHHLR